MKLFLKKKSFFLPLVPLLSWPPPPPPFLSRIRLDLLDDPEFPEELILELIELRRNVLLLLLGSGILDEPEPEVGVPFKFPPPFFEADDWDRVIEEDESCVGMKLKIKIKFIKKNVTYIHASCSYYVFGAT